MPTLVCYAGNTGALPDDPALPESDRWSATDAPGVPADPGATSATLLPEGILRLADPDEGHRCVYARYDPLDAAADAVFELRGRVLATGASYGVAFGFIDTRKLVEVVLAEGQEGLLVDQHGQLPQGPGGGGLARGLALAPARDRTSPTAGALLPYGVAGVLLAAGAYQFSPLKRVCLRACQSPLSFLMTRWRSGYGGTLRLGLAHAGYCVGCCWGLMAVLVAAGAMGLRWVLLIAVAVFAEKRLPRGQRIAWAVGAALIVLGLAVVVRPDLAAALRGQGMAMP
jgi:Predicted metal-binding integral membrane protein (DUF2182)